MLETTFTKSLAAAVANNICASQSGSAGTPLTINGSAAANGVATIDSVSSPNNVGALGRQVTIAYTGTDTSFVIKGTNASGNNITDTAVGNAGVAVSNLSFVTVTNITPVGGSLTGVTAGTNGVGASPWWMVNWRGYSPTNVSMAIELIAGAINYTIQYSYDDPNFLPPNVNFPAPFNDAVLVSQTATASGLQINPIKAIRLLINSGTGAIRARFTQAGIG